MPPIFFSPMDAGRGHGPLLRCWASLHHIVREMISFMISFVPP